MQSNQERYILWTKRNSVRKVIQQSEAVLFLNSKNYKLNVHYEAYQAIDLANEIKRLEGIEIQTIDLTQNFDNLYTDEDQNIMRQRSIYGDNRFRSKIKNDLILPVNVEVDGNILNTDLRHSPSLKRRQSIQNNTMKRTNAIKNYVSNPIRIENRNNYYIK